MDRTFRVVISSDYFQNPDYIEHQKRQAANKLAIELFQDIISRKNHSVVLIKEKEWTSGILERSEINYEISYELTESIHKDIVIAHAPDILYTFYGRFSWAHAFRGAGDDIKLRLKQLVKAMVDA